MAPQPTAPIHLAAAPASDWLRAAATPGGALRSHRLATIIRNTVFFIAFD